LLRNRVRRKVDKSHAAPRAIGSRWPPPWRYL
jgi:hypothetical protein